MFNPQEKTILEIQPSINSRNENKNRNTNIIETNNNNTKWNPTNKNETGNRNEIQQLETNCHIETKMNL